MSIQVSGRTGRLLALFIAAPIFLAACAQTRVVDSWADGRQVTEKPEKVAVVAVLPDALARKAVERDVAAILAKKGTPAIASSTIPGFGGGIRGEIDVEVATGILRDAGVDGIVAMFYSGGGPQGEYVRSDYWAEYVGTAMPYNWATPYFTGYTDVYVVHQGPGYADYKSTAYVESSFYDLDSRQPLWRIVTFTKDTEHTDTARDIANHVASEMRKAGLN